MPSWSASTRSPSARRWNGPSRSCRCGPASPNARPTTTPRHGTTSLFAALNVATGHVTDACYPQHRHQEFLKFLKKVASSYPGRELHVVCDNYATRKHPQVRAWLAKNPRITLHFTPTSCSWLNLAECFFSVITGQAIRRGSFTSVKELTSAIGAFIDSWNEHPRPFAWTKDAEEILAASNAPRLKQALLQTTSEIIASAKTACMTRCLQARDSSVSARQNSAATRDPAMIGSAAQPLSRAGHTAGAAVQPDCTGTAQALINAQMVRAEPSADHVA